jgi:hypothetical protein
MAINLARTLQDTQDQLGPSDTVTLVFKLFDQQMPNFRPTVKLKQQNIGDAFTVGHSVNGVIGTANGVGGGQITIGVGDLGSSSVVRVVSVYNKFYEGFRDTEYVDDSQTSATVNTSTYEVTF